MGASLKRGLHEGYTDTPCQRTGNTSLNGEISTEVTWPETRINLHRGRCDYDRHFHRQMRKVLRRQRARRGRASGPFIRDRLNERFRRREFFQFNQDQEELGPSSVSLLPGLKRCVLNHAICVRRCAFSSRRGCTPLSGIAVAFIAPDQRRGASPLP